MGVALRNPLLRFSPDKEEKKPRRRPGLDKTSRKARKTPAKGATRQRQGAQEKAPRDFAWLNRILILLGAGVVLVAGLKAWITLQEIPVQRISVTGELTHTRTEAVQDMVQPALVGGFLGADLQRVRQQLEDLPWIYEANVRRRWPNALEIHVVEQLPIARWGDSGFLNHEGQVFRPSDVAAWEELPLLAGPEGTASALMTTYRRLGDMLAPVQLQVAELRVDQRGEVEAVLVDGSRLLLGSEAFLERMRRFVQVYRTELAARAGQIERVDLRYTDGVAVRFAEEPAAAPADTE